MLVTVGSSLCVSGVYKVGCVFIVYFYYRLCLVEAFYYDRRSNKGSKLNNSSHFLHQNA